MARVGLVDTTFARFDMASAAKDELEQLPEWAKTLKEELEERGLE